MVLFLTGDYLVSNPILIKEDQIMRIIALFTVIAVLAAPAVYAGQECHTLDGVQYCKPDEQKDCIYLNGQRLCPVASAEAQNQQPRTASPQPVMDDVARCTQSGGLGYWTGTQYACYFPQAQRPLGIYGYGISAYSSSYGRYGNVGVGISIGSPYGYGGWYPGYGYGW